MTIVAGFSLTSSQLVLGDALDSLSAVNVSLEQVSGRRGEGRLMTLWASGADAKALTRAFDADPSIAEFSHLEEKGGAHLFNVVTTDESDVLLYPVWVSIGAQLLEATYEDGWWTVKMRFPSRDGLVKIRNCLRNTDTRFRVDWIREGTDDSLDARVQLTESQREALEVALESGYFDIPRRASLQDVGAELGISGQAVSERLRRGIGRLLETHLTVGN
ncbi:helix-turn-helix domain-containing protein [Haloarchaeobius sp. TZWWS8]|uniref:helix-turn-helix domain-containing protein n=1 Tax=Haloarchaeobius sp. TZWWS8 TaxID=3446121 RepID=UPI003EBBC46E